MTNKLQPSRLWPRGKGFWLCVLVLISIFSAIEVYFLSEAFSGEHGPTLTGMFKVFALVGVCCAGASITQLFMASRKA